MARRRTESATEEAALGADLYSVGLSGMVFTKPAGNISATAKSPSAVANPGATMTAVSGTVGRGGIPAGMSVLFDDAVDVVARRRGTVEADLAGGGATAGRGRDLDRRPSTLHARAIGSADDVKAVEAGGGVVMLGGGQVRI